MKDYQELVEAGIINENKSVNRTHIAKVYKDQLVKFDNIGIGEYTENAVKVTKKLIDITKKRLYELQPLAMRESDNDYLDCPKCKARELKGKESK